MMVWTMRGALVGALGLMVACTGGGPDELPPPSADLWGFSDSRDTLENQSCPNGVEDSFAMSVRLDVQPVSPGAAKDIDAALSGLMFRGGWALETPFASFGGLSGLKVLPDGNLLAVSDGGALVTLPFDQEELRPLPQATLSYLTDQDGSILTGKENADSEGLEVQGGVALVSFERDHRIEAYGYGLCGGNARAVPVARIGSRPDALGHRIGNNGGAEALVLDGDTLLFGVETVVDSLGPVGVVTENASASFPRSHWIDANRVPLVGLDKAGDTLFSLHRAYNPLTRQNTLYIMSRNAAGDLRQRAKLSAPLKRDNFEGIAALELPDGRARIFIISDDNFSDDQRTLLYVFETTE